MQPGGTQPASGPDSDTRLRLVALHTSAGPLELGGGLACVCTTPALRSSVAETIARAVIGPRPAGVDGTLEIAGKYVALQSLPAPLLRPSAAAFVDRAMLSDFWQRSCAQRRAELEATHAARRFDRHRIDAAIERARTRAEALSTRAVAPAPEPVAPAPVEPEADDVTPQLEALLAAYDELAPVPSLDAIALAEAFEELGERPAPPAPAPPVDIAAAEARVAAAERAVRAASGSAIGEAKAKIEAAHRAVVEAERLLFEAGRKERPEAHARYNAAVEAERAALADAGVDSYASFLVALAAGSSQAEREAKARADAELAAAKAALAEARAAAEPQADEHTERELELRARAAQLLGHLPGADPAAELRALRVEHGDASQLRDAMRSVLARINEFPTGDIVRAARAAVHERRTRPAPAPAAAAPAAPPAPEADGSEERRALDAEIARLLRERAASDEAVAALEQELAAIDAQRAMSFRELDLHGMTHVIAALLDSYRSAELLAGRLPIVLDGALDDLDHRAVDHLAAKLAAVHDAQMIVVTGERTVAHALATAGAATHWWPASDDQKIDRLDAAPAGATVESATTIPPMCALHPSKVAAANCTNCNRLSCIDCLVYVPGESALWCVACAESLRTRNLRLLRRRGA